MTSQSSKNIKIGVIITYITRFFSVGISLFYVPIMLGKLGQVEYGLYALVQSIVSYLQMSEMGIGTTATRYNSKYIAENDKDGQKTINGMFFVLYLLIALFCALVSGIIYYFLPSIYSAYSQASILLIKKLFLTAIGNLLITFVFKIFNSIIISYEKFIFIKALALIQTILGPVGMLIVLYMGAGSVGMLAVTTIISLVFGIIQSVYCFSTLKISFDFTHFKKELFVAIFKFTSFVFLNSLANQLFVNTDKIIVSIIMNETAVAIYAIVLQFDIYFVNFSNLITQFYLPKLTKSISKNSGDLSEALFEIKRISKFQIIIAGFIFGGFISIGKPFITLWIGNDYNIAYYLIILQFLTDYLSASQSMFEPLMQALNLHKGRAIIAIAFAMLKVVFTTVLVIMIGLFGCVIAYVLIFIIRLIAYNIYYNKKAEIDIKSYYKYIIKIYMSVTLCLGIAAGALYFVQKVVAINSYPVLFAAALVFVLLYVSGVFWFVLSRNERNTVFGMIKK